MRPVLHADLVSAARALLAVPEAMRAGLAERLIAEAEAADRYRRRLGRRHPRWGDGTLAAAAAGRAMAPETRLDAQEYCGCLIAVLSTLRERRRSGVSPRSIC